MSQSFEIYVISLKNQIDRREKIKKIFQDQSLAWSFFDAISGKEIAPYLHMYDRKKRLQTPGYDLRDNEIACFLSHRALWEECSKGTLPFLILEDDIKINENLGNFSAIENIINKITNTINPDFLLIRFGSLFKREFTKIKPIDENFCIVRYHRDPSTAMGYLISPYVAKKLVASSQKFFTAVDDFMWRGWENNCCFLDISPTLFFTEDSDTPSTIGDRSKPKLNIFKKIRREWFRSIDTYHRNSYEKYILHELIKNKSKFFH